jgi:hypothetical protein
VTPPPVTASVEVYQSRWCPLSQFVNRMLTLRLTGDGLNAYNYFMRMKKVLIVWGIFLLGLAAMGFAQSQDDEDLTSDVSFVVLKGYSGKPIRNAAVVVHPVNTHGKQERSGIELKTDEDGKAHFEGVPYGKMRIQVLVPGFQTYGGDYEIKDPTFTITVKMERPKGQYSIYDEHGNDNGGQQKPPSSGSDQKQ